MKATQTSYQAMQIMCMSCESFEYYTPSWVIEAARKVLGTIKLDPASCEEAQAVVQAETYYTEKDNGFAHDWSGKVWLNPPYGKINGKSNQALWSKRLVQDYRANRVTEAILLVRAALGYEWFENLWDEGFPVCFLRRKLSFTQPGGRSGGSSKQGTALFYLGRNIDKFVQVFSKHGRVIISDRVVNTQLPIWSNEI